MARKTAVFTAAEGRDAGKRFRLTEMPAAKAESWAIRVMLAMGKAGIDLPDAFKSQGLAGLVAILQDDDMAGVLLTAVKGAVLLNLLRIDAADALPLLEEMMGCVQRIEERLERDLVESDIEEVSTRLKLRSAVWNLHTDFFGDAGPSTSGSEVPAQNTVSSTIKTPRKPLRP